MPENIMQFATSAAPSCTEEITPKKMQFSKIDPRDGDETGKIFVGGLSWETTHATMLKFFSRYGEVIDCVVMKNPATGKSRGFGFVKFRDPACVEMVLSSGPHTLDGRQIDPKACNPRSQNKPTFTQGGKTAERNKNKIFLGGLPANCTETMIRDSFGAYGKVVDVVIMYDHEKQKSRGFGFLSFENDDAVDRVCQEQYVEVAGKKVEVKKAEPRDTKLMMAAMSGLAIPPGLLSGANAAFGMAGMQALPGHLAGYPHLQQSPVHGLTLLPATGPQLIPLTVGGNGVVPGSLAGAGLASSGLAGWPQGMQEAEPMASWNHHGTVVSAASPYYTSALAASTAMNGGAYTALSMESQERAAAQVPGLQVSHSRNSSPDLSSADPMGVKDKSGMLLASSVPQIGLLGSYPQEASSYGPARIFAQADKSHAASSAASLSYAAAPGVSALPSAYSAIGAGYGGMALPLGYGDGQAAYPAMLQARSLTTAQAFHPYRRAEDGR